MRTGLNIPSMWCDGQESVGWNEASFKVPDERAFQPRGQPVSNSNSDLGHCLFSTLPVTRIVSGVPRWGGSRAVRMQGPRGYRHQTGWLSGRSVTSGTQVCMATRLVEAHSRELRRRLTELTPCPLLHPCLHPPQPHACRSGPCTRTSTGAGLRWRCRMIRVASSATTSTSPPWRSAWPGGMPRSVAKTIPT